MKEALYFHTKTVAYFLWEYTGYENALDLWRCAEDMAFYAERNDFVHLDKILALINQGKYSYAYTDFVRNIAFRIYLFTGINDSQTNWFTAERLLYTGEWTSSLSGTANIFRAIRNKEADPNLINSEIVRRHYK